MAEAIAIGDGNAPTSIHAHALPASAAAQNRIATSRRLADNPDEATKGREWLTETLDETGNYLTSTHASYVERHLLKGLAMVHISI